MNRSKILAFVWAWSFPWLCACNTSEPTTAVLSNQYPSASDAGSLDSMPVYKGWWAVSQFPEPVPAGQVSDPVRIVPGSDYSYALLAPGWDIASQSPPTTLIPLRSAQKLSVGRGELLTFVVSAEQTVGDCRAGKPLTFEQAAYITERIFAHEFANLSYDAATCTSTPTDGAEGGEGGEGGP